MDQEQKDQQTKRKSLKDKYSNKTPIPVFTTQTIKDYVISNPPYDERFNRQQTWLQKPYSFDTWYFDIEGKGVFIKQQQPDDEIGILYNNKSKPVTVEKEIVLLTSSNEYFVYRPPHALTYLQNPN